MSRAEVYESVGVRLFSFVAGSGLYNLHFNYIQRLRKKQCAFRGVIFGGDDWESLLTRLVRHAWSWNFLIFRCSTSWTRAHVFVPSPNVVHVLLQRLFRSGKNTPTTEEFFVVFFCRKTKSTELFSPVDFSRLDVNGRTRKQAGFSFFLLDAPD